MERPLALSAYLAVVGSGPRIATEDLPPRPKGELLWGHATTAPRVTALAQLGARLAAQRPGTSLLMTTAQGVPRPGALRPGIVWQPLPSEHPRDVAVFLDHWKPNLCLWTGGHLRPCLIDGAAERGIPLFLIDADEACYDENWLRWVPGLGQAVLAHFATIFARSGTAARRLRRLGAAAEDVNVTGPLQEGSAALPCDDAELGELTRAIAGRPVWMAAMTRRDELHVVTRAHRAVSRLAHRLLLVVVPNDTEDEPAMSSQLEQDGWSVARWSEGVLPDEAHQILLADSREQLGLWYRIAPVTFMGSSMISGGGGRDPFEPAALGSAILYGPNVGRHLDAYTRLATAGAARIVKDSDSLSTAVANLIAPNQAATMAHAGWQVISEGAEVTDQVLDLVQDTLDLAGHL